jgi:hypothetical protein
LPTLSDDGEIMQVFKELLVLGNRKDDCHLLPPSSTTNWCLRALTAGLIKTANRVYSWFSALTQHPVPKPLSIFTTQTFGEQKLCFRSIKELFNQP